MRKVRKKIDWEPFFSISDHFLDRFFHFPDRFFRFPLLETWNFVKTWSKVEKVARIPPSRFFPKNAKKWHFLAKFGLLSIGKTGNRHFFPLFFMFPCGKKCIGPDYIGWPFFSLFLKKTATFWGVPKKIDFFWSGPNFFGQDCHFFPDRHFLGGTQKNRSWQKVAPRSNFFSVLGQLFARGGVKKKWPWPLFLWQTPFSGMWQIFWGVPKKIWPWPLFLWQTLLSKFSGGTQKNLPWSIFLWQTLLSEFSDNFSGWGVKKNLPWSIFFVRARKKFFLEDTSNFRKWDLTFFDPTQVKFFFGKSKKFAMQKRYHRSPLQLKSLRSDVSPFVNHSFAKNPPSDLVCKKWRWRSHHFSQPSIFHLR